MPLPKTIKIQRTIVQEFEVINHTDVTYQDKKYVVCYVSFHNEDKLFVIDESHKDKVIEKKWTYKKESGNISHSNMKNGERTEIDLQHFLIYKYNPDEHIDCITHINNNKCDNRLENLVELNENEYMNIRQRNFILPADTGINIDDIPKYIVYRKADKEHSDKFIIDIKLKSGDINWHSTSSKNIDTKTKLKQTIDHLNELNKTNLELIELNKKINNIKKQNELKKSFNEILLLSGYPDEIINKNLINLKKDIKIEPEEKLEPNIDININIEQINDLDIYMNEKKDKIIKKNINMMNYQEIYYDNKKYIVGYCSNNEDILFVVDYNKKNDIINNPWQYNKENKYILRKHTDTNGTIKYLYQHKLVFDGLIFDLGSEISIDHINQIGRDNRIENLRELSQSHQNINRGKLKRKIELPDGCGINPQDIPTNIYYRKPQGLHGDRFYVEIPYVDPPFLKDSTSSKSIDLKTKLQQAILILEQYKKEHPDYAKLVDDLKNKDNCNDLRKSFNDILQLSGFPQAIIDKNLAPLEDKPQETIDQDAKDLAQQLIDEGFKGVSSNLPVNCGVTSNMIPKYCYYKPASDKRGDKFIIERHPKLITEGKRQWATTESKLKTTKEKYDLMIQKLNELNNLI
jgi:hypothetical protein